MISEGVTALQHPCRTRPGQNRYEQTQQIVAELKRKIRESEQIVAAYERQSRRPLSTDFQTLASAPWSKWNDRGPSSPRS
jgi:hypothetical protein